MNGYQRPDITAGEAAKLLGVTRQTVINRAKAGKLSISGRTPEGVYIFSRELIEREARTHEREETASGG